MSEFLSQVKKVE
jgi:hypothetical protein